MRQLNVKTLLRQVFRALLFYAIFILVGIPLAIGFALFTLVYSLAMLGPWLAGEIAIRGRFRGAIDRVFGIEHIHRFRDDIKMLVGKHAQLQIGDRSANEIRQDIYQLHEEASTRAERGEFIIALVTGVFSLAIGPFIFIPTVGLLLASYSLILSLTISLHVVVLDILAYNRSDDLSPYRRKHLILLEGWNRAILTDYGTQAGILAVGIMYRVSPLGYELAKEILDELMGKDMDRWEQIGFVVGSLGTLAAQIIRDGLD